MRRALDAALAGLDPGSVTSLRTGGVAARKAIREAPYLVFVVSTRLPVAELEGEAEGS